MLLRPGSCQRRHGHGLQYKGWTAFVYALGLLVVASCGAPLRDVATPEDLQARRQAFQQQEEADYREGLRTALRRMELITARASGSSEPTFDMLLIHGGGAAGGFAAGVLDGWGRVTDPCCIRPEFDHVSGSSSGSLVAPFAFLGSPEAYARVLDRARNPPTDWGSIGPGSFWPRRSSLLTNANLAEVIQKEVDEDTVAEIKQAADHYKVLLIATTDLDLGLARVWDLGIEARRVASAGDLQRIHSILLASTAIPIVLPPVEIDGALYADGGVAATLFLGVDLRGFEWLVDQWQRKHPHIPMPRIRVWSIVNAQRVVSGETVQPRYLDVGGRSLAIMMEYDRLKALLYFAHMIDRVNAIEGVQAEFRYITIPESARVPKDPDEYKDKEIARALVEVGRRLGADPSSWSTGPPDLILPPGSRERKGP